MGEARRKAQQNRPGHQVPRGERTWFRGMMYNFRKALERGTRGSPKLRQQVRRRAREAAKEKPREERHRFANIALGAVEVGTVQADGARKVLGFSVVSREEMKRRVPNNAKRRRLLRAAQGGTGQPKRLRQGARPGIRITRAP